MRTVIKRLARLEDQFVPPDQKARKCFRLIVCRYGAKTSLENATCKRTLCPDGTVMELVELNGSYEGSHSVTAEELDRWVASFPIEVPGVERPI
ncbi:MAG: hypothetical protein ABSH47_25575 [Bryobacteraceae bacterium]|jgi:hypothetical protein